jgi:hypothetical protein
MFVFRWRIGQIGLDRACHAASEPGDVLALTQPHAPRVELASVTTMFNSGDRGDLLDMSSDVVQRPA